MEKTIIDASGVYYRQLNENIRAQIEAGVRNFELKNVNGQRYIGAAVEGDILFEVNGVPGQDMAAFMRGPTIRVHGNAQDGVGNTMDDGKVVIGGMAGDVLGYAMRGGRLYIKGDVGYRVGIHMKAYMEKLPIIVVGGKAGDFLGEYMAGGAIILLGMFSDKPNAPICGRSLGTGMHGGAIYVRGEVPQEQIGPFLKSEPASDEDMALIRTAIQDYAKELGLSADDILAAPFYTVKPYTHRPYKNLYVAV